MTDEEEDAWVAEQREQVIAYLQGQGLERGPVGEWPAIHLPPYVSLWAIESLKAPGSVGWWAISGDCPTDYCSSSPDPHPRAAVREFARTWRAAAGDFRPDGTLGETGLPETLAGMLVDRAAWR